MKVLEKSIQLENIVRVKILSVTRGRSIEDYKQEQYALSVVKKERERILGTKDGYVSKRKIIKVLWNIVN